MQTNNNNQTQSALPNQEHSMATFTNEHSTGSAIPFHPQRESASEVHNRTVSNKPRGLLTTQAAQIKRLNQSLSQYKQKISGLQRQKTDRDYYEKHIQELSQSDASKKNQIEKLSLTIRSLIASCQTYRRQVGTSSDKTRKLEEVNKEIVAKNEYLTKSCETLKKQNQSLKSQTEQKKQTISNQLNQNQSYVDSLKINNEDLLQRVSTIPEYEKTIFDQQNEIAFWKGQSQKRSYELTTMNDLYRNTEVDFNNLSKRHKNLEETHRGCENQYAKLRNELNDIKMWLAQSQNKNAFLIQKCNQLQTSLNAQPSDQTFDLENRLNQAQKEISLKSRAVVDFEKQVNYLSKSNDDIQIEGKKKLQTEVSKLRAQKQSEVKALNVLVEEQKHKHIYTKFLLEKREVQNLKQQGIIKNLQDDIIQLSTRLSNSQADKTKLIADLHKYKEKERKEEAENMVGRLTEDLRLATQEIQNKIKQIEELQNTIRAEKEDKRSLEGQIQDGNKQISKSKIQISNLQLQVDSLKKNMANLKNQLLDSAEINASLKQKIDKLQEELASTEKARMEILNKEVALQEEYDTKIKRISQDHESEKASLQNDRETLQQFVEKHFVTQLKLQKIAESSKEEEIKLMTGPKAEEDVQEITLESQEQASNQLVNNFSDLLNKYNQQKQINKQISQSNDLALEERKKLIEQAKKQKDEKEFSDYQLNKMKEDNAKLHKQIEDIASYLEKKTSEGEKLKVKIYQIEEQLREEFQDKAQANEEKFKSTLEKSQKEKEQAQKQLEKIQNSYQVLQRLFEDQKVTHNLTFNQLSDKNDKMQKLYLTTYEQKQKLLCEIEQRKSDELKYELMITKLSEELQRLQGIITSMQQKQKTDQEQNKAKMAQMQVYLNLAEEKAKVSSELEEENKNLKKKSGQYEEALLKLQNQFISLQLLISELKQERNLLLKKNSDLLRGIQTSHDQLERLNQNADKTNKVLQHESEVHKDLQEHYNQIQSAFNSLEKFKVSGEKQEN